MFGKPKTAEDILKLINNLPDAEKEKVLSVLNKSENAPAETETQVDSEVETSNDDTSEEETQTDSAEENTTEGEAVSEESSEQVEQGTNETTDETVAEEPSEESSEQELPEESEAATAQSNAGDLAEVVQALVARIDNLEAKLAAKEQQDADNVEKDNNQDFGVNPQAPNHESKDETRMDAVLKGYAGENAHKYK